MSVDDQLGEIEAARKAAIVDAHVAQAAADFEVDVERSGIAPHPTGVRLLVEERLPGLREEIAAKVEAGELGPLPVLSPEEQLQRLQQQQEERTQARIAGRAAAVEREDAMSDDPSAALASSLKAASQMGVLDDRELLISIAEWGEHGANPRSALEAVGGEPMLARARDAADRLRVARAGESGFKIPGKGDTLYVIDRRAS